MGNPFTIVADRGNGFTRNYGGTQVGSVADPYISGYHFIKFVEGQPWINNIADNMNVGPAKNSLSSNNIATFLAGSCLAVTPPGGTLNKAEFIGLGGTKWSVPTNIDYGNTITIKFLEFSWLPVLTIFHGWTKMIRDYRTGVSTLEMTAGDYSKSEYAASMYYWTTKPDGRTVEYCAMYSGMFPTKDPQDLFTGDLTAVDKLELDIEFNVDWIWHEDWVYQNCQGYAQDRREHDNAGDAATQSIEEETELTAE